MFPRRPVPRFLDMSSEHPAWRVRAEITGKPPVDRIQRACGVSDVDVRGQVVRCRIDGSFQPFLEALRACEVVTLQSAPLTRSAPLNRVEGGQ